MPIIGLTDRQASFPEIGRIRKGAPKTEEGYVGRDLTYFRVEFDEREKEAITAFHNIYGDTPAELNILLPFNSVDENFEAWKETYVAGGLVHRCDGERIWYEIDPKTGEQLVVNGEPYKVCDGSAKCKPSGRLKVLIPELQRLAFLTVLTTSYHDVMNISRQLKALLQINGRLAGVPLKLRRRPMKISTPGNDGKRARRTMSLLSIEADPEWVKLKLTEMKMAALPDNGLATGGIPQLEASEWDEEPTDEIINGTIIDDPPPSGEEEADDSSNGLNKLKEDRPKGKRPWPPEIARERVLYFAGLPDYKGVRKDEKRGKNLTLVQFIAWQMTECFPGEDKDKQDAKRISALKYLYGKIIKSTNDLSGAQLRAIERLLDPQEYGGEGSGKLPSPEARREIVSMVVAHLKEQGQQEMIR